jgi:hypothetical protein
MKDNKIVKQAGAWYEYTDTESGEVIKFQSKDFITMMESRVDVRDQIYKKICESTILQYKSDTLDIENMEIDESGAGMDD